MIRYLGWLSLSPGRKVHIGEVLVTLLEVGFSTTGPLWYLEDIQKITPEEAEKIREFTFERLITKTRVGRIGKS